MDIKGVALTAVDNAPPAIAPLGDTTNIASEQGKWIRGTWNASFAADSQAGVCQAWVAVNDVILARGEVYAPDTGSWTQCGSGAGTLNGSGVNGVSATVDTTRYANGPLSIEYYASDPAQPANVATPTYRVNVDNAPVTLALAGPTQALSSAGPQTVVARAIAGPSGVAGIACSVDGSPAEWHGGGSDAVQVSQLGLNTVRCRAENGAVNPQGAPGLSALESWTVDIQNPSVSLVALAHVANSLRCARRWVRLHVPARWIVERYHHHKIRVRVPAEDRRVQIERCHPRVRSVHVRLSNGRTRVERVVELPHRVSGRLLRVPHGHRALVSGWLGTPNGNALSGQEVEVETAPADGNPRFRVAVVTRTRRDGTWSARLRPGPSRLIEASYNGTTYVAPSRSRVAAITVPASPSVRVAPRDTRWGHTIVISGRLRGGYVPASGELVVLRIGWRHGSAEIGHVYTDRRGRFRATYTFLRGTGTEAYRIWAQTARESDYPFAPASSPMVSIRVSS